MSENKAPNGFWTILIALASTALSAISIMIGVANRNDNRFEAISEAHADSSPIVADSTVSPRGPANGRIDLSSMIAVCTLLTYELIFEASSILKTPGGGFTFGASDSKH